jgi:hypothetical protein
MYLSSYLSLFISLFICDDQDEVSGTFSTYG